MPQTVEDVDRHSLDSFARTGDLGGMNSEFSHIQPPQRERPKISAEHILWDELLSEPPVESLTSRFFDKLLVIGSIAGVVTAVAVAAYGLTTALR